MSEWRCIYIPNRTHHISSHGCSQYSYRVRSNVSSWKAPLAAAISSYLISLTHPCMKCRMKLTNRFHVAVRLFSNRSQMTSKCGKNKKVAREAQPSVSLMFLPHFDVLCDSLLNRRTATWNLFVLYTPFAVHLRKIYNHLRQQLKL